MEVSFLKWMPLLCFSHNLNLSVVNPMLRQGLEFLDCAEVGVCISHRWKGNIKYSWGFSQEGNLVNIHVHRCDSERKVHLCKYTCTQMRLRKESSSFGIQDSTTLTNILNVILPCFTISISLSLHPTQVPLQALIRTCTHCDTKFVLDDQWKMYTWVTILYVDQDTSTQHCGYFWGKIKYFNIS